MQGGLTDMTIRLEEALRVSEHCDWLYGALIGSANNTWLALSHGAEHPYKMRELFDAMDEIEIVAGDGSDLDPDDWGTEWEQAAYDAVASVLYTYLKANGTDTTLSSVHSHLVGFTGTSPDFNLYYITHEEESE